MALENAVIRIAVIAVDPLLRSGLVASLGHLACLELVDDPRSAEVIVTATEPASHRWPAPVVLITTGDEPAAVRAASDQRRMVSVPGTCVTPARLQEAILQAHANGQRPAHAESDPPTDIALQQTSPSLSPRETDILQLLAEGLTTAEIARHLAYAERTVQNLLYALLTRLEVQNRTHAVAYALRRGLI